MQEQKNLERALDSKDENEIQEIVKIIATYFEELCNCTLEVDVEDGFYEITFNTDQDKNSQYITGLMKKMAPKQVTDKWIVNAYLPPLSNKALNTILRIGEQEYDCDDFMVYYELDEVNQLINIELYCSGFKDMSPNKAVETSMYMIRAFIGETEYEARVGTIDAVCDLSKYQESCLLKGLYEVILDVIESKKWTTYSDPTQIYNVFKLDEAKITDEVRHDMKLIMTTHSNLIIESLNDEAFIANQFFDMGGEFGYLYFEHHGGEQVGAIRQNLQQVINEIFYNNGIARSIGGAIGTNYAYIDLCVFDKEAFNELLPKLNDKIEFKLNYNRFE